MDENGFTIMEMVVVLAVVAILAGILTPRVITYIEDSRITRTLAVTKVMGEAVLAFNKDTALWPVYVDGASTESTSDTYDILITPGSWPGASGGADWLDEANDDELSNQLAANTPGYKTTGSFKWRGPYAADLDQDPWGYRYIINVEWLAPAKLTSNNAVYIISPGPNGDIETNYEQSRATATVSGDDIWYRIR